MTHKAIFLNGPIGCGKDTIGNFITRTINNEDKYYADTFKFADKLYEHTAELFQVDYSDFVGWVEDRNTKEQPLKELNGYSPREALIFTSESVYKPIHGKDYFGKALVETFKEYDVDIALITDSGFYDEAKVVVEALGAENCLLVNICRDGCAFGANDSRGYINLDDLGVKRMTLSNNSTVEHACSVIMDCFNKLEVKTLKYSNGEEQILMDI